jgi:hypothetical protein
MQMTAVAFRERFDGEGMMQRFRQQLVYPYRDTLRTFAPLTMPPGWTAKAGA